MYAVDWRHIAVVATGWAKNSMCTFRIWCKVRLTVNIQYLPIQKLLEVPSRACDMWRVPREMCHTWDFLTSSRVQVQRDFLPTQYCILPAALLTACFSVVTSQYFYVIITMILKLIRKGIINIVGIKSTVTLVTNITVVIKLAAPPIGISL